MKQVSLQSAEFKRDYVAASAVVIFVLIVISEVVLAVAIPTYLYRENAMALQVRRLRLLGSFDGARNQAAKVKARGTAAKMEQQLVSWNLDRLAVYLRSEGDNLTSDEIAALQNAVSESQRILATIERGKSFSTEAELDTGIYVNSLIPKAKDGKKP